MSTKVVILLVAAMVCVTALVAVNMLDDGDPEPAPSDFSFCPPGRDC